MTSITALVCTRNVGIGKAATDGVDWLVYRRTVRSSQRCVPIQALVVLKVADAIPDIFKTVLNVRADLSVAAIIARFSTGESPVTATLA